MCVEIFDMIRKTYQVLEYRGYREYSMKLQLTFQSNEIQITHLGTKPVFPTFFASKTFNTEKAHSLFEVGCGGLSAVISRRRREMQP